MKVCLGGTFDPLHAGHEALLAKAFALGSEVFVGVTEGGLAARPDRTVAPTATRIAAIQDLARRMQFDGKLSVRPLGDAAGPAATGEYDAIVVTPETVRGAEAINEKRNAAGLPPLEIVVVPHVLAEDRLPISATRIHAGEIDREGRRLRPLVVAVGSQNAVKVDAVRAALEGLLPCALDVRGVGVASGVPEQPKGEETLTGARNRARHALAAVPEAQYAVGVEAGLMDLGGWMDVQACVIVDCEGHETHGWGPGFGYPTFVTERALGGEMISDIIGPIANDPRIGGTTGAIGYLTDGRMDRTELSRIAVLMAFVPRVRRALYAGVSS